MDEKVTRANSIVKVKEEKKEKKKEIEHIIANTVNQPFVKVEEVKEEEEEEEEEEPVFEEE